MLGLETHGVPEGYDPERSVWSKTGFVGVIKVKGGRFQARVQVRGDGRGGVRKRRQHSLPGLFDTAYEAALCRAAYLKSAGPDCTPTDLLPVTQDKQHKSRKPLAKPPPVHNTPVQLQPPQMPMASALAMPLPMPMAHLPLATATPMPMQPFGLAMCM